MTAATTVQARGLPANYLCGSHFCLYFHRHIGDNTPLTQTLRDEVTVEQQPQNDLPDDFNENESPWRPTDEFSPGETDLLPSDQNLPDSPDQPDQPDPTDQPPTDPDSESDPDPTDSIDETPDPAPPDPVEPDDAPEINTPAVIEAVLFAADEPVTPQKLVTIVGTGDVRQVRRHIADLNRKYQQMTCSFRIETIAGGYQMLTLPDFNIWLRKLLKVRSETKLSPAALETLAVIAYKQPVLRVDIEAIRGVAAGEMVRQLIEKGLVKIVGRAEVIGRPLLYGTTRRFLEVFGLGSLKDLPTAQELKEPE